MFTSQLMRLALAAAIVLGLCDAPLARLSAQQAAPATIRRVITGNDSAGKSYVVSDERVPAGGSLPGGFRTTAEEPLGKGIGGDARVLPIEKVNLDPGIGGSQLTLVNMPATTPANQTIWHRTATVDYAVVAGGEIVLMLDKGEVTLRPGDIAIQRNTLHAWRNASTTVPASMWVVILPVPSVK